MKTWTQLFRSPDPRIRVRAAKGLLEHGSEIPLPLLLEIFDELHNQGLGARTERVLLARNDPELLPEMIRRIRSPAQFVRQVACTVLGRIGNSIATQHLLQALDDPAMIVRRAAAFALADIRDGSCATELLRRYQAARHEDSNVRMAMECALKNLGVEYVRHSDTAG